MMLKVGVNKGPKLFFIRLVHTINTDATQAVNESTADVDRIVHDVFVANSKTWYINRRSNSASKVLLPQRDAKLQPKGVAFSVRRGDRYRVPEAKDAHGLCNE